MLVKYKLSINYQLLYEVIIIRIQKFFKNRQNIFYYLMLLLMLVLIFKLAVLTIIHGEDYRVKSDSKTIKDIPIKAPRGKIYDRNGIILADNVSSFTIQILKDQIDKKQFNELGYTLSKILDLNCEKVIDEFPIIMDSFEFKDNADTNLSSALEEVIDIVVSNNLMDEILEYKTVIYDEEYNIKERALLLLKKEIDDLPVSFKEDSYIYNSDSEVVAQWLDNNDFSLDALPQSVIADLYTNEKKYTRRLFSNSKVRKAVYNLLSSKGLTDKINLVPYVFSYDNEYEELKNSLSMECDKVTLESQAKDDFVNLVLKYSIDKLLTTVYHSDTEQIVPGITMFEKVAKIYPDLPVVYSIEDNVVKFTYTEIKSKNKALSDFGLTDDTTAYELVKHIAGEDNILYEIITEEDNGVRFYAQSELLGYVNPSISVKEWEYRPIIEKDSWIEKNIHGDIEGAENVFKMLREETEIDESINDYDARNIFVIRERYIKQGYLAFHPIDICYGASEKTVAMISEMNYELIGVNVEVEPQRYYPMGETAAHVIGYLGKISQDYEIEEYIKEKDYSPDDIIGKTGVEEKFEDLLNGKKGKKTVEINALGNTMKSVDEVTPIPGGDLYLTLDIELQEKAEAALKKALEQIQIGGVYESKWGNYPYDEAYKNANSGALVAIDVKTGEVLALVNYPSYDLNLFSTGISNEDYEGLLNDSKDPLAPKPLLNISLLTAIQPGSTFKIITSLAALEKGIPPEERVYCAGVMEMGGHPYGCWIWNMYRGTHGYENLYEAIRDSCNFYFYTIVLGENQVTHEKTSHRVTLDDILYMAEEFGLNDKTGIEIDIPREYSGGLPNPNDKIESTKMYLRLYLEQNIDKYFKKDVEIDVNEKNDIIDNIISWVNLDESLTRNEVYRRLSDLNIDPMKTNDAGTPITDIIKYSYLNQAVWTLGDTMNISIGQGSNSYTPIQMANYIATVANDGYRHNVSVIKKGVSYDGREVVYTPKRESERVDLSNYDYLGYVRKGMKLVSESDTHGLYANFPVEVGSKTGTAEKDGLNPETGEPYDDFGWYVAFAPYDDPQIAVASVIFQGGSGRYPAPAVRDVIAEYLKLDTNTESE